MAKKKRNSRKYKLSSWGPHAGYMIKYCDEILYLTRVYLAKEGERNLKTFTSHRCVYPATLRYLHLLGESTNRIPLPIRGTHPEIEWRKLIATRNVMVHRNEEVKPKTVFNMVEYHVPNLLPKLHNFKNHIKKYSQGEKS